VTTLASTTEGARWHRRAPSGRWLAPGLPGRRFDMTIGATAHMRPRQRANAVLPRPNDSPRTTARSTARPGACAGRRRGCPRTVAGHPKPWLVT
jgi:hypothetical protein